MANEKSLSSGMNSRPMRAFNQRPSANGQQNARQINQQRRPMTNSTVRQMDPIQNDVGKTVQPATKSLGKTMGSSPAGVGVQSRANNAKPSVSQPQNANAITNFVDIMKDMVGGFAILDEDVIKTNLNLAAGQGMSTEDRTISFECVDYLVSNMAFIFMGLVLDKNFKEAFLDSLMVELQIDKQPADVKAKTRDAMKDKKSYKSNGSIVLGLTTFTPNVTKELVNKMNNSFKSLGQYGDDFDNEVSKLSPEQKVEYGFIFSNFMYLIRAFTHNDMFMSYIITVIEKVKELITKAN